MGTRQPVRISPTPVYGVPQAVVESKRSAAPSGVLPLLVLVVALAVATMWYVGLPALDNTPRAVRTCEVVVLESGSTACVRDPARGSRPVPTKPARAVKD
jgi:hypothetical protein